MDRDQATRRRPGPLPRENVALLLPGMTLNGSIMPPLPLEAFAVDFTQWVPGLPDERITMGLYAARLRDVLAREPLWRRPRRIVVAHSFGGMLALQWLLDTHADDTARPQGLVLIATTAGPMFDVVRVRLARLGGRPLRVGVRHLMGIWNRPAVTRVVKALLSPSRAQEGRLDFRSLRRTSDFAVDLAGWRNTDWRAMRAYRLAMSGLDLRDRLASLTLPTTILHGTDDALFPLDVARDLASRLPNAHLRVVEGAGHVLPLTHGEAVVEAVAEMLRGAREPEGTGQAVDGDAPPISRAGAGPTP